MIGGGAILADAAEEVRTFVHKVNAPVASSLMGKGAFPETDELYTGMIGMHGTKTSNLGVMESDLLITIGARFSDRVTGSTETFARKAKILQIDVDAAEINKNVVVDASVIGDVKEVLKLLNEQIPKQGHEEWLEHIRDMKERYPMQYNTTGLTGPCVIEALYEATNGEAIVTTDVGQHQMWAAQYYKYTQPTLTTILSGLPNFAPMAAPRPYPIVPSPPEVINVRGCVYL